MFDSTRLPAGVRADQALRRTAQFMGGVLLLTGTAWAQNTATTGGFNANGGGGAGLPDRARTRFFDVANNADIQNTAEHELLHGIGFAVFYNDFRSRVRPANGAGQRDFTHNGMAGGNLRMTLGPAGDGTHLDPGLTVGGTDQATRIMRPDQVVGQRMGAFERVPLDDAFGWTGRNLDVRITFDASFPAAAATRANVTAAETAAQGLFGSNGTGHRFDWTVMNVPPAPRRGERQTVRTDAPYELLPSHQATFQDGNTSIILTNISHQLDSGGPATVEPDGTLYSLQSNLTADAIINSPSLGLVNAAGQLNLSGLSSLKVFNENGFIESEFLMELVGLQLAGTFVGPGGPVNVSLRESSLLASMGEESFIPTANPNEWAVDSFFDVFAEISLEGGGYIPSGSPIYLGYVPEPGTLGMAIAMVLAAAGRRRRTRT